MAIVTIQINILHKIVILIALTGFLTACAKPVNYQVKASVTSTQGYGVIVYDLPLTNDKKYYRSANIDLAEIRVNPMIPGEFDTFIVLPPFEGYEGRSLPNEISLRYQYAMLSDCSVDRQGPAIDPATSKPIPPAITQYHTKRNCQVWQPVEKKIYTKMIDLRELNSSDRMKALGTKNRSGNRIGVELIIEFFDDGTAAASLENTIHNRWK